MNRGLTFQNQKQSRLINTLLKRKEQRSNIIQALSTVTRLIIRL